MSTHSKRACLLPLFVPSVTSKQGFPVSNEVVQACSAFLEAQMHVRFMFSGTMLFKLVWGKGSTCSAHPIMTPASAEMGMIPDPRQLEIGGGGGGGTPIPGKSGIGGGVGMDPRL